MSSARPPFPKKKVAVLFGYAGTGYSGLQLNPGCRTVESVLLDAMLRAGLIWEANAGDPKKIDWQRACRTDKGVHAAGNVVSCKALLVGGEKNGAGSRWSSDAAVDRINELLPDEIKVFDIVRVTNSFDAHVQCDSRYYEYVFPSFLLMPSNLCDLFSGTPVNPDEEDSDGEEQAKLLKAEELDALKQFRVSADSLARLQKVLQWYVGTKCFHNFTIGKLPSDPSAQRFIRSFAADNLPFVVDGVEWIRLRVHGASFMIHQIRKMAGLAILVTRFGLSEACISDAFDTKSKRINVPKAPGVGLFLDEAVFDGYNKYIAGRTARDAPEEGIYLCKYEGKREALKHSLIYPAIFTPGIGIFAHWMDGLKAHSNEFEYLKNYLK